MIVEMVCPRITTKVALTILAIGVGIFHMMYEPNVISSVIPAE